jgi:TRAP-type C4-dicarboxylate transport system substrate-binding protein
MNYNDIYEAVQRGTVDGALATLYLTEAWKHYEVASNMTLMKNGFVVGAPQMSISLRVWNSFPDALKQIFKEVEEQHNQRFAKDLMELEDNLRKKFEGQGMKFYNFSPDDEKSLADAGQQADQAWIQEIAGRGAPAQQTWDNFQKLNKACMDDVAARGYPWAPK